MIRAERAKDSLQDNRRKKSDGTILSVKSSSPAEKGGRNPGTHFHQSFLLPTYPTLAENEPDIRLKRFSALLSRYLEFLSYKKICHDQMRQSGGSTPSMKPYERSHTDM